MPPSWMENFNNDPLILVSVLLAIVVVVLAFVLVACVARKSVADIWQSVTSRTSQSRAPSTPRSQQIELRPTSARRSYRRMRVMQTIDEEPNGEAAASNSHEQETPERDVSVDRSGPDGDDGELLDNMSEVPEEDSISPTRRRKQKIQQSARA